jgi:hypothetical protein
VLHGGIEMSRVPGLEGEILVPYLYIQTSGQQVNELDGGILRCLLFFGRQYLERSKKSLNLRSAAG